VGGKSTIQPAWAETQISVGGKSTSVGGNSTSVGGNYFIIADFASCMAREITLLELLTVSKKLHSFGVNYLEL
jgi:hypothetical protein